MYNVQSVYLCVEPADTHLLQALRSRLHAGAGAMLCHCNSCLVASRLVACLPVVVIVVAAAAVPAPTRMQVKVVVVQQQQQGESVQLLLPRLPAALLLLLLVQLGRRATSC